MDFSIENDILCKDGKSLGVVTPPIQNCYEGENNCNFLIIHYTATLGTSEDSVKFARDPKRPVSWHLSIDRDGEIVQLLDFRKQAWHAGNSEWTDKDGRVWKGFNRFSIGIEHINCGFLTKKGEKYFSWDGKEIPSNEVFHLKRGSHEYWQSYTDIQLEVSKKVSLAIANHYNCIDILGHEEISPGRKFDPGPAYPMGELRHLYHQKS